MMKELLVSQTHVWLAESEPPLNAGRFWNADLAIAHLVGLLKAVMSALQVVLVIWAVLLFLGELSA
ncbi:MAG: hypothetical protein AAFU78_15230, partial [Cyanobacteria bacterium J06633_2]